MRNLIVANKLFFWMVSISILVGIIAVASPIYLSGPANILFVCFSVSVFLLVFINPVLAMLVTLASTPFNEVFFLDIGVKIRLYEVMVLVMFAGWGLRLLLDSGELRRLDRNPLIFALVVIFFTSVLSFKNTVSLSDSLVILGINVFLMLLYFFIYQNLYSVVIYKQALLVFVFFSNLVAAYGIYQSIAYFVGIDFLLGPAEKLVYWQPHLWGCGRAFSTFAEPVEFAAYTMAAALFLIPFLNNNFFHEWKPFIACSLVLQIVANLFAMSRMAWSGLLFGIGLYLLFLFMTKKQSVFFKSVKISCMIILVISISSVLLAVCMPEISKNMIARTLQRDTYSTVHGRMRQIDSYVRLIPEHPIFGHGVGMGPEIGLKSLGSEAKSCRGGSGPNIVVSTLFQTGILGLIALIWLYISFGRNIFKGLGRTSNAFFYSAILASFLSISGLLLTYQMNYFFIQPFFWCYLAFGMAAVRLSQLESKCLSK